MNDSIRSIHRAKHPPGDVSEPAQPTPEELLVEVAKGDEKAFERLYDVVAAPIYGVVRRVVRDIAQSEEVTQEVLVELWRTATRYNPELGGAVNWALTLAHRRAVDRVRSAQASTNRDERVGAMSADRAFDEVAELLNTPLGTIKTRLRDGLIRLRDCLGVTA